MAIEARQVFLVPGRKRVRLEGGAVRLAPTVEHCVAIANSAQEIQLLLEQVMPDFMPSGFTSLAEFEAAVVKIRLALAGEDTGWLLVADPALGSSALDAHQVFLAPGQRRIPDGSGIVRLAPVIEHCVVIAASAAAARGLLARAVPDFGALEFTSLASFEDAVRKLRASVDGSDDSWPLVAVPGIA